MIGERVILSPVESAVDDAMGEAEGAPALPEVASEMSPIQALENAVLPALLRPPCFVMFSGGRDSSLVLAAATRVARREGLPLPTPITQVFPDYPESNESGWQEVVLGHLKLREHTKQEFRDELNLLGPVATESIRRHGLLAPAGMHLCVPTFAEATGGSIMTGMEGDGLFNGGGFARTRAVLLRQVPPTARTPLSIARGLAPERLRRMAAYRRNPATISWLRPAAHEHLRVLQAVEEASEPIRWDRRVAWWARQRYVLARRQSADMLARSFDVKLVNPLLDETFLGVLARRGGPLGWGTRARTLTRLFGELLPSAVFERESKADFTRAYWSGDTRRFIAGWDGTGVPTDIVDIPALRATWLQNLPDARSGVLLHAAWAASAGAGKIQDPFNCRLE